jgi:thioredoxin reductase
MSESILQPESMTDVAVIGAGPYGLSIAAHLAARGVRFRIFGRPMVAWAEQMPKGMHLKSEGFASSLSDPGRQFTLAEFCRQQGLPYLDTGLPVPLETFVSYGMAFQKKFAPNLENKSVTRLQPREAGFEVQLDDGETFLAHRVIVATGIVHYAQLPAELRNLTPELVSHSSAHHDLSHFAGRRVGIIGSGASALDLAALLHEAGATAEVIARSSVIRFHDPPQPRSLYARISQPATGIGAGRQLLFYCKAPHLFRLLPESLRLDRVRKTLGPAPGWFVRDRVVGKVPLHVDRAILQATEEGGRVRLEVAGCGGARETLTYDHVIAATGYRVDLERLGFLGSDLLGRIRKTGTSPALSGHFESSVPGLYFIGVSAANSFGPMMRFAYGAEFTARRLSAHLARRRARANAYGPTRSESQLGVAGDGM